MKDTAKIVVGMNDAMELKRVMYQEGCTEMPAFMHEIINYGLNGFLKGRGGAQRSQFDMSKFNESHQRESGGYADALQQIKNGRKTGHWIWYIFPQIKGLGKSANSQMYGLSGIDEAREFLFDHTLGRHLLEIAEALLDHRGEDIQKIVGSDAIKIRSSMTLFSKADPSEKRFKKVLDVFFDGKPDGKTLEILGENGE